MRRLGRAEHVEIGRQHDHAGFARFSRGPLDARSQSPAQDDAQTPAGAREELQVVLFESAITVAAIDLDPSPASERVTARGSCNVADSDRPQDLVPAWRAREIAAGLEAEAAGTACAPGEIMFRREVLTRVLEFERPSKPRAVVVIGKTR